MTDNISELVKRLRERHFRLAAESNPAAVERRQLERDQAADALEAQAAEIERLRAALVDVEDRLNCRGNPDIAHYCPNCDNSQHAVREIARKALEEK